MDLSTVNYGGFTLIKIAGRLDVTTAPEFEKFYSQFLGIYDIKIALDFSSVEYMSSLGLRSILSLGKKLKEASGELLLCGLQGVVKEVIMVSGFDNFFKVYENADCIPK